MRDARGLRRCIFYKLESHIPFIGALLKKEQDVDALLKYDEKGGRFPKSWEDLGPRYNQ